MIVFRFVKSFYQIIFTDLLTMEKIVIVIIHNLFKHYEKRNNPKHLQSTKTP